MKNKVSAAAAITVWWTIKRFGIAALGTAVGLPGVVAAIGTGLTVYGAISLVENFSEEF